jgi:hypothetical protein
MEQLTLQGTAVLGEVDAPALKAFSWVTVGVDDDDLDALEQARWPRLERFSLWAGSSVLPDQLLPVLAALPAGVTSLALCNSELDGLTDLLASLPLASRLERLDLSKGTLDDEGARRLLARRAQFPRLTALDVSENFLSLDGVRELGEWVPTTATNQRDALESDGERYVAVGE